MSYLVDKDFADCSDSWKDYGERHFLNPLLSDVILKVGSEDNVVRFPAHKIILCQSPVFSAMLTTEMKEAKQGEVYLPHFAPDIFKLFLRFLYFGRFDKDLLKLDDMVPLMACADHFGMEKLRDALQEWLVEHMMSATDSVVSVLAQAREYHQQNLVEATLEFAARHFESLPIETLVNMDATSLQALLKLCSIDTHFKQVLLFQTVLQWCQSDQNLEAQRTDPGLAVRLFAIAGSVKLQTTNLTVAGSSSDYNIFEDGQTVCKTGKAGVESYIYWTPRERHARLVIKHRSSDSEWKFGIFTQDTLPQKGSHFGHTDVPFFWISGPSTPNAIVPPPTPLIQKGAVIEAHWNTQGFVEYVLSNGSGFEWRSGRKPCPAASGRRPLVCALAVSKVGDILTVQ